MKILKIAPNITLNNPCLAAFGIVMNLMRIPGAFVRVMNVKLRGDTYMTSAWRRGEGFGLKKMKKGRLRLLSTILNSYKGWKGGVGNS